MTSPASAAQLVTHDAYDRYSRLFINQRLREVYDSMDTGGDGLQYPEVHRAFKKLGYKATKKEILDICWEVDEVGKGAIEFDAVRFLLHRLQKAPLRCVGTGSNLFRGLLEYMMFDTDGSGRIDMEEVQQMLYVYYGFRGYELERKVRGFQRLRAKPKTDIRFKEFQALMDQLMFQPVTTLDPGLDEPPQARKPRPPRARDCVPEVSRSPSPDCDAPEEAGRPPTSARSQGAVLLTPGRIRPQTSRPADRSPKTPRRSWMADPEECMDDSIDIRSRLSEQRFKGMSNEFMEQYKQDTKQRRERLQARQDLLTKKPAMRVSNALMKDPVATPRKLKKKKKKKVMEAPPEPEPEPVQPPTRPCRLTPEEYLKPLDWNSLLRNPIDL